MNPYKSMIAQFESYKSDLDCTIIIYVNKSVCITAYQTKGNPQKHVKLNIILQSMEDRYYHVH